MPQYSYVCSNPECGAKSDLTAKMEDRDKLVDTTCLTCGDGVLKRKFNAYNILNAGRGDIL
jgi:predicted nucleic acid-binding Zn ribbon protein